LPGTIQRRFFWIFARVCFALYRTFPIFGSLRAAIAIIHREGKFLVILRNDGRGVSLPGGICNWREAEEAAVRREVREETGLELISAVLQMSYHSRADVPCEISVFEATVRGEVKDSWEGSPQWMTVAELKAQLVESQWPVLDRMKRICGDASPEERAPSA
jgi:8-oxo-dGTP pyrophosphatase MutT (NUDIX family)